MPGPVLGAVALGVCRRLFERTAEHAFDVGAGQAARAAASVGRNATMVDSTPTATAPPSTIRSIRPRDRFAHGRRSSARRDRTDWPTGPPRAPEDAQDVARHRMGRYPDRDGVEAGGGEIGDCASVCLGQHQRQRAGPKRLGQPQAAASKRPISRAAARSPTWAISGLKAGRPWPGKAGNRRRIGGIGPEPINRLGRERDQPASRRKCAAAATTPHWRAKRRFQAGIHRD